MTATWPSRLPSPLRADFGRSYIDTRVRKQADSGPPAYRRRYSLMPMSYKVSIAIDQNQLTLFDDFYARVLANGTRPFIMARPELVGAHLLDASGNHILDAAGRPMLIVADATFIFGDGMPTLETWGAGFRMSFELVLLP